MNKEAVLKGISKIDDKLLVAKILDKYTLSQKVMSNIHSDFLDPYQQNIVRKCLEMSGIRDYIFFGGFSGAERTVVFFCPYYMPENTDSELFELFEILKIKPNTRENFSHRDYLGSLMGLGIKREKIGDILVREDFAFVVVLKDIADYIKINLTKVGNARVEIDTVNYDELETLEPKVKEITSTVASLRLDAVASAGFGISRSKIADLIRAERVSVNWETTNSLTKLINEGDTISIRGKGRVVLEKIGNTTKKDRIHVLLKKFI
ncbi:MAG TPA: YlmH/Sll1252 family protein [Acetivibrio sp.]|uniref:YlmH family RNA-binding protein n=1 Tax=Acetivibrio sp. TaxID=1872092 RepID=UPI002C56D6C5|nr:YlmH/Sll1252 family protein [Acetivibrio sp.]HOM01392.1 YlmH/Sll1252 family protein [Acetivibrio sp.]